MLIHLMSWKFSTHGLIGLRLDLDISLDYVNIVTKALKVDSFMVN